MLKEGLQTPGSNHGWCIRIDKLSAAAGFELETQIKGSRTHLATPLLLAEP